MTLPPVPEYLPDQERRRRDGRRVLGDQRLLFLVVGLVNTGLGTVAFVGLQLTLGQQLHYLGVLLLAHVLSVLVAFALHRRYVFRVSGTGSVLLDLARFESVYLGVLGLNLVVLPLLVEGGGLGVIPSQLAFGGCMAVLSWFGHKNFSFRRPGRAG